ncbi:MAG TPA: tetratricopeptide repeat protein [Candidatus Limnocylindria bacterium]|nr:tetratricopeptide repeat protein [Candidatus Limnocylindria bacterium]
MTAARELPGGTVTFLFTDIEGSTQLLHDLGAEPYAAALAEHRRILRTAFAAHGGFEVDTQGDSFFVAFPTPEGAVAAAAAARDELRDGPIGVRMGIHTGTPLLVEEGYVGPDVHLGARIAAAGHGGQVLLSKATRELVAAELTDLGEHRLKDFDKPVVVFQLGSETFPPLKTISNTNLPRPASSFVGRDAEVAEVVAALRDGARFLTLTGPGGSGKTRLAIEAAADVVGEFKAGVFWVGLAPLRDPTLVTATVAQTLGAKDDLAQHIGEREMLLLLDNLEQVIDAATDIASLVEACPNLRLLVTSRERLRVRGEVEYPVAPLADPDAVALFCARAHVEPDETVAELCRRLDNLPLAVELAAARTSVLTPGEILARVADRLDLLRGGRDADARQQTLRATIVWSFELLTAEEQRLFARMSVFAGGATLDSAVTVVDAELDTLQSLVDKSLVRHTEGRFWMLETIREFAGERLEASGDAEEIRRRHLDHFFRLAEEAEASLNETGIGNEVLDELERELDNFRTALDFAEVTDSQRALRLAGALTDLWDRRGHHAEGLARLERLVREDDRPTGAYAWALNGVSQLASRTGDLERAMAADDEALALHRSLGDRRGQAVSLWGLGYLHIELGNPGLAVPYLEEAVDLFRETGDAALLRWTLRTLGFAYLRLGDLDNARPVYDEALERARAAKDDDLAAGALGGLVGVASAQGKLTEAAEYALEGLRLVGDSRDVLMKTSRIVVAADVVAALGEAADAVRLVTYAQARYADLGAAEPWVELDIAEIRAIALEMLGEKELAVAEEAGRGLTTDEAFALAHEALAGRPGSVLGGGLPLVTGGEAE